MMVFGGTMSFAMASMIASSSQFFADSGVPDIARIMGAGMVIFGLILLFFGYRLWKRDEKKGAAVANVPPPYEPQRQPNQTVEVIKVRCTYCGTLNQVSDAACSSCGARL
jgi:hypothetical protein